MKSRLIKPITRRPLLPSTISTYFKNSIGFSFRLTPTPTNPEDLNFIYDELNKLAPIDIFKTLHNEKHGFFVNLIFNPCREESWYGMIGNSQDQTQEEQELLLRSSLGYPGKGNVIYDSLPLEIEPEFVQLIKNKLINDKLSKIIAIPRYEFIKNNKDYFNDKLLIYFSHNLKTPNFRKRYKLNSSIGSNSLIYIDINQGEEDVVDIEKLRNEIRHNFTKFYKFDKIEILNDNFYRLLNKNIFK